MVHAPPTRSRASSTSTLSPRPREIGRAGEPVVPRPDYDGVPRLFRELGDGPWQADPAKDGGGRAGLWSRHGGIVGGKAVRR